MEILSIRIDIRHARMAFFDIDGTLSIPRYKVGGRWKPGGSKEWFKRLCETEDFAYVGCRAPETMKKLVKGLKGQGSALHVVSEEPYPSIRSQKLKFLEARYPGAFPIENIHFVDAQAQKAEAMHEAALAAGEDLDACLYVDDDFGAVLAAAELGFDAHHVSELVP